jgi:formiminotetrahydrofolate cyclodeaminase
MEEAPGGLTDAIVKLAAQFAAPGPPFAGSAAAATGAIAAGLLEWAARLSERRGPESFRPRALTIARRAVTLQASLGTAAQTDATGVKRWIAEPDPGTAEEARSAATESVLDIGARCAQIATLAAELVKHGHAPIASDARAALQLASSAAECALQLAEANLRATVEDDGVRSVKRRLWRTRRLLQRASPSVDGDGE